MKFTANPSGVDAPVVDGGSTLVNDRRSPFLLFQKKEDTGFTSRSYSPFRTMMRMKWYLNSRRLVNFSHDETRVVFGLIQVWVNRMHATHPLLNKEIQLVSNQLQRRLHHNMHVSATMPGCRCARGDHSIVKLKTTSEQKKSTFFKLHHQNGSNFYQLFFMSRYTWYLLHSKIW